MLTPEKDYKIGNYIYAFWRNVWNGDHKFVVSVVKTKTVNILGFKYVKAKTIAEFKVKLK